MFDKNDWNWIDRIDLTPGLTLSVRRIEHPMAGPLMEIVSTCPSGPMESRCAPRGWFKDESGMSMPVLPPGWDQAKLARALAVEIPDFIEEGFTMRASEDPSFALLVIANSTGDPLDQEHVKDPSRSMKRAGLSDFDPWDKAWIAIDDPIACEAPAEPGTCRALIPLDQLGSWMDGLVQVKRRLASIGRPFDIQASFEGAPLANWLDLKRSAEPVLFFELPSLTLAPGEKIHAMDPQGGGGVSPAMGPGVYRVFLSRAGFANQSLCMLADDIDPAMAHAAWGMALKMDIHVGNAAGFFKGRGSPLSQGKVDQVFEAASRSVAAGSWDWGAGCHASGGGGAASVHVMCQDMPGGATRVAGAKIELAPPSPEVELALRGASASLGAREMAREIAQAVGLKKLAKAKRVPRM